MLCPYCQHPETKVVDKRDAGGMTRRRRECLACSKRFSTREALEEVRLRVLKKDGRREDFDRDKVRRGVMLACQKRPVSTERIERMMNAIEEKLKKKGKEVPSTYVGELVSKELKKADKVAYIRFASIYREFADMDDFKKEIRSIA